MSEHTGFAFPNPGEIFVGRYQIERVLGQGGFARVYLATQVDLERPVAIKVLRPVGPEAGAQRDEMSAAFRARFELEAKLISKLHCPNTVVMYDYGATEHGLMYMVLEYIEGATLKELLRAGGALGAKRSVKILRQVLSSLHEAHLHGILHRDLKPDNIMVYSALGLKDNAKVLDFGIAKMTTSDDAEKDLTSAGVLVGTPRYMAPERFHGQPSTASSDIYSMGLVVYEMMTGHRAIADSSTGAVIARHIDPTPFALPPDLKVPDRFRATVNKMMEKDPAERYVTAEEVLEELEEWASEIVDITGDIAPLPAGVDALAPEQGGEWTSESQWAVDAPKKTPVVLIGVAVVALLILATALVAILNTDSGNLSAATTTAADATPAPTPIDPPSAEPAALAGDAGLDSALGAADSGGPDTAAGAAEDDEAIEKIRAEELAAEALAAEKEEAEKTRASADAKAKKDRARAKAKRAREKKKLEAEKKKKLKAFAL